MTPYSSKVDSIEDTAILTEQTAVAIVGFQVLNTYDATW
jgi:hypothetical protein